MRKIVAISMPDEMYEHVRRHALKVRYASVSEYVRELIRNDLPVEDAIVDSNKTLGIQKADPYDIDYTKIFDCRPANEFLREYRESIADEKRRA